MATFKIKIKSQGQSQFSTFTDREGKFVAEKIKGAIEDQVYNTAGRIIAEEAELCSKRNLFLAAVFFQRVVSRTPLDEDYMTGMNERGHITMHYADNDSVRDCWVASYRNKKITAKALRENCGCNFDKFNDRSEIQIIYNQFLSFMGKNKKINAVHIDNTHERFPMLEYGEYAHDGSIKKGPKYEHGVKNGFSIQAPVGMLRLTQQEFADKAFEVTDAMLGGRGRVQSGLIKKGSKETVKKILKGKSRLTNRELEKIAECYR